MSLKFFVSSISVVLLCSCGPTEDDPSNIPMLGNWNSKIELESVTQNGIREDRYIPNDIAEALGGKITYSELGCTEPKLVSVEDLNEKLPSHVAKMCTITPISDSSGKTRFKSICDPSKFPAGITALSFTGEAKSSANLVEMKFRVRVIANSATGNAETMEIVQNRNFWRTGDCA